MPRYRRKTEEILRESGKEYRRQSGEVEEIDGEQARKHKIVREEDQTHPGRAPATQRKDIYWQHSG